jgi:signal transduction histidine kinase
VGKNRQAARLVGFVAGLIDRARRQALLLMSTVPFVLLIVGAVGIVGYLSFRNAEEAIGDLANQLMAEVGQRVDQNLSGLLDSLEQITRSNAALVSGGKLDPSNRAAVVERLSEQLGQYRHANTVALASEQRDFTALERDASSLKFDQEMANLLILREFDQGTKRYISRRLTAAGERGEVTGVIENYDPHNDPPHDPWYAGAKAHQGSFWFLAVSVARGLSTPDLMIINFLPIYDDRQQVLGVAGASTFLTAFGQFLTTLRIGRNGQAFVIDKRGNLVATSSGEEPFRPRLAATYAETAVQDNKRLAALDSRSPLTAASAKAVLDRVESLGHVVETRQFTFRWEHRDYFLQVVPIRRGNLDWLTVIVVPEADFMEHIDQGTRSSVFLAILALLGATLAGVFTARWIIRPILRLNAAAKSMAEAAQSGPRAPFLANMSHELRTPLNAILGFSALLRRDAAVTGREREHLDIINRSGEHLLGLINDILDMAKIEAGRVQLQIAPFDLGAMVRDIMGMMGQRALKRGLELRWSNPREWPATSGATKFGCGKCWSTCWATPSSSPQKASSPCAWTPRRTRPGPGCGSRWKTAGRASPRKIRRGFSTPSCRRARPPPRKAPGWGWRSPGSSWS